MTVNELIAKLQVLATQGHGELDVLVYDDDYGCYSNASNFELINWDDGQKGAKPFIRLYYS